MSGGDLRQVSLYSEVLCLEEGGAGGSLYSEDTCLEVKGVGVVSCLDGGQGWGSLYSEDLCLERGRAKGSPCIVRSHV